MTISFSKVHHAGRAYQRQFSISCSRQTAVELYLLILSVGLAQPASLLSQRVCHRKRHYTTELCVGTIKCSTQLSPEST